MDALNNLCDEFEVSTVWLIDGWGSFLAEEDYDFEDLDEFRAWSSRQRLASARRRSADGSLVGSCWIGALTDAGCVYFKNRRH
jgi:hypothetical protein